MEKNQVEQITNKDGEVIAEIETFHYTGRRDAIVPVLITRVDDVRIVATVESDLITERQLLRQLEKDFPGLEFIISEQWDYTIVRSRMRP